jgi:murein DD-endopeptidase MepM/ murein hydrolase activator NlpD
MPKIKFQLFLKISLVIITVLISVFLARVASSSPQFSFPIDCSFGHNCYIMHYVDLDPTPQAVDFGCGRQTYDNHQGTDFGIANLKIMAQGVAVKAIASGTVLRVRDGVKDQLVITEEDKQATKSQECGNGIVIEHENGWESQYCHLKQNSIVVQPGMKVEKGTKLGLVGASGLASFPHVHLSLRYQGEIVDPFVGVGKTKGCQGQKNPLWAEKIDYKPTGLIDLGFAPEIPTQQQLWQGKYEQVQISNQAPLLIFWIHAYGLLSGDVEFFRLTAPNGTVIVNQEKTLDKSSRSWMSYVGKRNRSQLEQGKWQGEYRLQRGKQTIIEITAETYIN